MGDSLLVGGGAGGGIRTKKCTWEQYQQLSDADKNNPYVKWLITDKDASEFISKYVSNCTPICTTWEVYCKQDPDEQLNPGILWIITDKEVSDLATMGIDVSGGSKYYTIGADNPNTGGSTIPPTGGTGVSNYETVINNLLDQIKELKEDMGGLKFRVNEDGTLQIYYPVSGEEGTI